MNKLKVFFLPKKIIIKLIVRLFFIPLILPTLSSYANVETIRKECLNIQIEKSARNDDYIYARDLERFCACAANNYVQDLSPKSCPSVSVIEKRQIDRYFD